MKTFKQFTESKKQLYFPSYAEAVEYALNDAKKKYQVDEGEVAQIVGLNSNRPKEGDTTRLQIPLYRAGSWSKISLNIQVYNRGGNSNPFELNFYIS